MFFVDLPLGCFNIDKSEIKINKIIVQKFMKINYLKRSNTVLRNTTVYCGAYLIQMEKVFNKKKVSVLQLEKATYSK